MKSVAATMLLASSFAFGLIAAVPVAALPAAISLQDAAACEGVDGWLESAWNDVREVSDYSRLHGSMNDMSDDEILALQDIFRGIAERRESMPSPVVAANLDTQITEWGRANVATIDLVFGTDAATFEAARRHGTEQAHRMYDSARSLKRVCGFLGTPPFVTLNPCYGEAAMGWWELTIVGLEDLGDLGDRMERGDVSEAELAAGLAAAKREADRATEAPIPALEPYAEALVESYRVTIQTLEIALEHYDASEAEAQRVLEEVAPLEAEAMRLATDLGEEMNRIIVGSGCDA